MIMNNIIISGVRWNIILHVGNGWCIIFTVGTVGNSNLPVPKVKENLCVIKSALWYFCWNVGV